MQLVIFLIVKIITKGNVINITKELICQIVLHDKKVKRKITNNGKINSALDNPNHTALKALPLLLLKYLDMVVVEV